MDRQLNEIGTIPVTTSIIESLYPELKSANKKVTWLEKQGVIIRLKRGLYVINRHYKIFCVNGNTGFRNESRIFYFIHLQNEEDYERKESSSA